MWVQARAIHNGYDLCVSSDSRKITGKGQNLYIGFVNLSKAFDTVDRELRSRVLPRAGCPDKFVKIVKQFHERMCARVRVGGFESEEFGVSKGVKQGCVLTAVILNIFIHYLTQLTQTDVRGGMWCPHQLQNASQPF